MYKRQVVEDRTELVDQVVVDLLAQLIEDRIPALADRTGTVALLFVETLVEGHRSLSASTARPKGNGSTSFWPVRGPAWQPAGAPHERPSARPESPAAGAPKHRPRDPWAPVTGQRQPRFLATGSEAGRKRSATCSRLLAMADLGASSTTEVRSSRPPRSTMAIKRVVDITVAAGALTLTLPLLIVSAIAIKIDSKGPVFFRQVRIGKNGRRFTMYKLRTMVADAEARLDDLIDLDNLDEPAFKIPNDPRITRVGRYLRRSSLDEIPQFINVLSGKICLLYTSPSPRDH